ncbi:nucleotidyltransferase family protein [Stappia stellulata]|uniref:nucleotidyltransferase family protein n=1 Tax=Stappia stellulata TaxID=71235 RepID=UPI001FDEF62E|nr:nucleotidyltransferase family protein [Stappia stellulata]
MAALTSPRNPIPSTGLALDRTTLGDPALASEDDRRRVLELLIRTDPDLMRVLRGARRLALPDWRLASGAVYQTVWNALTGREAGHGIKDFDLLYFDGADTGYEAEDREIARGEALLADAPAPVEIRNQARVHLWFQARFARPYPKLRCTDEALLNYASKTHAVAVRLENDDRLSVAAPFGLADVFAMRLVPNPVLDNAATYVKKAQRMSAAWPEIEVVPWPAHAGPEHEGPAHAGPVTGEPSNDSAFEADDPPRPVEDEPGAREPADQALRDDPSQDGRDWMSLATSPRTELPK